MTLRETWEFQRSAADVSAAAKRRVEHHTARAAYWLREQQKAEDELRTKGIDIRHHDVTGGRQAIAVLDPTLAARLSQCETKWWGHLGKRDEFQRWVMALDGTMQTLQLHKADLDYFWPETVDEGDEE